MSGRMPFYRARWFHLTIGFMISAACMAWAARELLGSPGAWARVVAAFQQANYWSLPLILLVLFVFYLLKAWRWKLMLSPVGSYRPVHDLLGPILIGFAFNNALPARVGEFVRCYVFSRQQKLPLVVSLSSVVLERIFDAIAIVLYLAIGLVYVEGIDPEIQRVAHVAALMAGILAAGGLVFVIWSQPFLAVLETVLRWFPFIPRGLTDKVCRTLEASAHGLSSLKDVRLLIGMLLISLVKWALNASLFWLALWSFDISISVAAAFVLAGVVAFAVALPQAPGYFGTIQLCFMEVMKLFNVDPETVFAASIYYHLSQWIPVTVTGFLFFGFTGLSIRQVERAEDRLEKSSMERAVPGE